MFLNFAIFSAFLYFVMPQGMQNKLTILLVLGGIITLVSFIDDLDTIFKFDRDAKMDVKRTAAELQGTRKKTPFIVPAKIRLLMQVFVGAVVGITSIKIGYISGIFGGVINLESYYIVLGSLKIYIIPLLFTIIWYVIVFNSVNWSDGIPGLTSGMVAIAFIIMAILTLRFYMNDTTPALRENSVFVFSILAILIPSSLVAWYYNLIPRVLLGESGVMFASFIIASLAILVWGKIATAMTVLGVYLIDAFYVIAARILSGKSPLEGDRIHHLHYRLMNIGFSENFVRNFVYIVSFFFGIAAAFLDRVGKIILFFFLAVIIVFITKILSLKR